MKPSSQLQTRQEDYFWLNISTLPYFRGMLRAIESRFYDQFEIRRPVLDMGCGDGQFASVTFADRIDLGVDPWTGPIREAKTWDSYHQLAQAEGAHLPVSSGAYQSVISNSVLEHIPDLEPVIAEIGRVTKKDGLFLFCVPNHNFLDSLSIGNFLDRIKFASLADSYRNFFNRISRHHHCDSPQVWEDRLNKAGFEIIDWWHYFSPQAFHRLEWGHYFGLPSLVSKFLFKKWILSQTRWNLILVEKLFKPFYDNDPRHPEGVYTFYAAKKVK